VFVSKNMFKIKLSKYKYLGAGVTLALLATSVFPASAQQIIVIEQDHFVQVNPQPITGSFIYGSPIPTPMPVNPSTGLMPSNSDYFYPQIRQKIQDPALVNRIFVNPTIQNSTLVNPVIVNTSEHRRPLKRRSRVLIQNIGW
jgi:hypothetical protein